MATQTKDTLPWKLRTQKSTEGGALTTAQISSLCTEFDFSSDALLALSRNLNIGLSEELHLSQPELRPAKIKKGIASLRRAIKGILSAEEHLSLTAGAVEEVRFRNPIPQMFSTSSEYGQHQVESFVEAVKLIADFREYLEIMARNECVIHMGIPDKRRLMDVRRTMVCVAIFNYWDEHGRLLTYTTDPITSVRRGKLFDFVNAVVECISDPPSQLNGDTIRQELKVFIASCSKKRVSERIARKKVNRPT